MLSNRFFGYGVFFAYFFDKHDLLHCNPDW